MDSVIRVQNIGGKDREHFLENMFLESSLEKLRVSKAEKRESFKKDQTACVKA